MNKWVLTLALILGSILPATAEFPATLTTLRAVHALSDAEASKAVPVAFEATVTYFKQKTMSLTVQDEGAAIYVYATTDAKLIPGDRVLVRGTTESSFRPIVVSNDVTVLSHGALPKPVEASFDEMIRGDRDCMLVTERGVVRAADLLTYAHERITDLQLLVDGGYIEVLVDSSDANTPKDLLDAEVEVTGVVTGKFDGKKQLTGIALDVSTLADVKILKRASADFRSLPVTPMDQVLGGYHVRDFSRRIHVKGTITYYQPGTAIVLESGTKSLWIRTQTEEPMRIGDVADASGFPNVTGGYLILTRSEVTDSGLQEPIAPRPVTWQELSSGVHSFDLVSIEGRVLMTVRGEIQDEYVLESGGHLFSAIYRHPSGMGDAQIPPMKQVASGSRIRVSGICMLFSSDPINGPMAFDLLLRSPDDVTLVAHPSWLNVNNLIYLIALLLVLLFVAGTMAWASERRVRYQNATAAYSERRRRRILEDIHGSRPLAEIIEQITELVSFRLRGAPCWCQVADGARLGNCPANLKPFRVISEPIPAHSGAALGTMFAAFDPLTKSRADESDALSIGTGLATLAIETRRLYTDLLHRSEFDLLTDIHNRFSLEKLLDAQIHEARMKAEIFGLIYIDLDGFKQINDVYGHAVGDLYLQEVALRMKGQLRSFDTLARQGGDEFAVLVPAVRNRAEVEEIALRLEGSFCEPVAIGEYVLQGTASVGIALYPENGATRDSLLNAADAAMYAVKNGKRGRG